MEPEEDQVYDLRGELNLLDLKGLRLYIDAFGDLTLELPDGKVHEAVTPIRAFPITSEEHFIVLRDKDGEELGTIKDITHLDRDSRKTLRAELRWAYFTPEITMVNSIEERNHVPKWDVETDRGPRVFEIRTSRDVRVLEDGRILIRDADGNRLEVPDYRTLDPISQAMVESQI